jgi:8-oxo-dGTP pyrophosphatase MutT (NUDIX family)
MLFGSSERVGARAAAFAGSYPRPPSTLCARAASSGAMLKGSRMPERRTAAGWRIVESEIVIETPHLRLRRDDIVLPDGTRIDNYYVRESRGFCVICALTPDHEVVLVSQYKHGIGRTLTELPAGAIDPGETPEACAVRELAEETGYAGDPPERLATFVTDPTNSDASFHLFLVREARLRGRQRLDATEDIAVRTASLAELRRYARDGTIEVSSHVASIYRVLEFLGTL